MSLKEEQRIPGHGAVGLTVRGTLHYGHQASMGVCGAGGAGEVDASVWKCSILSWSEWAPWLCLSPLLGTGLGQ